MVAASKTGRSAISDIRKSVVYGDEATRSKIWEPGLNSKDATRVEESDCQNWGGGGLVWER